MGRTRLGETLLTVRATQITLKKFDFVNGEQPRAGDQLADAEPFMTTLRQLLHGSRCHAPTLRQLGGGGQVEQVVISAQVGDGGREGGQDMLGAGRAGIAAQPFECLGDGGGLLILFAGHGCTAQPCPMPRLYSAASALMAASYQAAVRALRISVQRCVSRQVQTSRESRTLP